MREGVREHVREGVRRASKGGRCGEITHLMKKSVFFAPGGGSRDLSSWGVGVGAVLGRPQIVSFTGGAGLKRWVLEEARARCKSMRTSCRGREGGGGGRWWAEVGEGGRRWAKVGEGGRRWWRGR